MQAQGFSVQRYGGSEIWASPFCCAEEVIKFLMEDLGTYEVVEGSLKKGAVQVYLSGRNVQGELSFEQVDGTRWRLINSGMAFKAEAQPSESALSANDAPKERKRAGRGMKKGRAQQILDIAALRKAGPMECAEVRSREALPHDPQWMYEVKWDGFRCIVVQKNGQARMFTRRGNEPNARFKHIVEALAQGHGKFRQIIGHKRLS